MTDNKYEAMVECLDAIRKMDVPVRLYLNRWGEWSVYVLGQKFIDQDVCVAVLNAFKLVVKLKQEIKP